MNKFIIKKIRNQLLKVKAFTANSKLNRFKKSLQNCGEETVIQFPVVFEGKGSISLGKNVFINAFVHIWGQGGVEIGDDSQIASHVAIVSVTHPTNARLYREELIKKKVVIKKNAWIGSHATILPGITIGNNAIVGAGSVVTKDVPDNTTVVGVPARVIKTKS